MKAAGEAKADLVARAVALAAAHHAGAVDKGGHPYILHPLRVMLRLTDPAQQMAAALHDLMEDCGVTESDLLAEGFPPEVVRAVVQLTRRHGEEYMDFVARLKADPIARAVKMADIADNMDLSRIPAPTERDHARLERYREALALLSSV